MEAIYDFIAADSLYYAEEVIWKIEKSIWYLEHFPLIGTKIDNMTRYIVEPTYRYKIIYQVREENIYIVSVFKYKDSWSM